MSGPGQTDEKAPCERPGGPAPSGDSESQSGEHDRGAKTVALGLMMVSPVDELQKEIEIRRRRREYGYEKPSRLAHLAPAACAEEMDGEPGDAVADR